MKLKPFQKAMIPEEEIRRQIEDHVKAWEAGNPEARAATPASDALSARAAITSAVRGQIKGEEIYMNDRYQVNVRFLPEQGTAWPAMFWLSIKERNRGGIHDWRVFQEIKNMLVGPENEAVELYPAESRKVDTANQYHLFVIADAKVRLPFGYQDRLVLNSTYGKAQNRKL